MTVKKGDKLLAVRRGSWGGPPSFYEVEVQRVFVQKSKWRPDSDRLTLVGDGAHWVHRDPGKYEPREHWESNGNPRTTLYLPTQDLIEELKAEQRMYADRGKLKRLGEVFARMEVEEAAKIWADLPDNIKELVK